MQQRENLSASLAEAIRELILDGGLEPGARINEVRLAARLEVSRTPLREALTRLAAEGAVTVVPRHGFYVAPLTAEEVEHLYPLRAILDPAALRLAGLASRGQVAELKRINRALAKAADPAEAVRLDDRWHLTLLSHCPNPLLLGFIEQMMWRTRRYELGLMRARANVARATGDHDAIVAALEAGELERACAALEANMIGGKQPILDWLEQREALDAH
jgi:DNA-binding GntR family transcriptional regulator